MIKQGLPRGCSVLHIGKYYSPFKGGIENFTKELVETDHYHQHVRALHMVHHEQRGKKTCVNKVGNSIVIRVMTLFRLLYSPLTPTFGLVLNRLLRRHKVDVIHVHCPNLSAFWLLFFSNARKIPWVIHWHSDVLGAKPDWRISCLYPIYRVFELALLKHAAKIVVTSPNYLERSMALRSFQSKCEIIPLGLPDLPLDVQTKKGTNATLMLKLLMVGRLTYYKGHELLIRALPNCANVELDIVGSGEYKDKLLHLVNENNLSKQVRFHGFVSDKKLQNMYKDCDLVCLPSIEKTEAFGLVLLEAARASKPSLVTNVPGSGMSWVVDDKKTGLVVSANSINSISDALNFATMNHELLTDYGFAARKKFESEFQIDRIADKIMALYKQVISHN